MNRIHRMLIRIASGKLLAVLALLLFPLILSVNLLDMPISLPRMKALTGGRTILDMLPFYTAEKAYQMLTAYGPAGRQHYLRILASVDILLPILAASFLAVALTLVFPAGHPLRTLNVAPVLALCSDYAENAAALALLLHYPSRLDGVASLAGVFTLTKHVLYWGSVLLVLYGLAVGARRHAALWHTRVNEEDR